MTVYQEFDARISSSAERPGDLERCYRELLDLVSSLPQSRAQLIPEKRARNWVRKTMSTELVRSIRKRNRNFESDHPEDHASDQDLDRAWRECVFHVKRASGIGGSEIGDIILHLRDGKRGDFGDARSIAMSKLLIFSPLQGDDAMERGHRLEETVRRMHHEEEGSETCEEGMRRVRGSRSESRPYLTGNPDDLTLVKRNGKMFRFVDDYKCPSPDVFKEYLDKGPSFGHVCQLHQYDMLCEERGVKISGLRLVPFEYAAARPHPMIVPRDQALRADIEKYSDIFWNQFVMLGRTPEAIETKVMEIEDPRIREEITGMSVLKGVMDGAKKKLDESKERVFGLISEIDSEATGSVSLGFSSITRKISYDLDALISIAEAYNDQENGETVDISDLVKTSSTFSTEKVKEYLRQTKKLKGEELEAFAKKTTEKSLCQQVADAEAIAARLMSMGISVSAAIKTEDSFELTRKKSGLEYETKETLLSSMKDTVTEIYDKVMADPERFLEKIRGLDDPEISNEDMSAMPEM